jgi:hypothetical protein
MYQQKYGGLSFVKLSECESKTETKLMTFCECGKKIIMIQRSGMLSRISGRRATEVRKGTGNNGMGTRMDIGDISK